MSKQVKNHWPDSWSIASLIRGSVWLSGTVLAFNFLKLMQNCNSPPFLRARTTALVQGLLLFWITPSWSISSRVFQTSSSLWNNETMKQCLDSLSEWHQFPKVNTKIYTKIHQTHGNSWIQCSEEGATCRLAVANDWYNSIREHQEKETHSNNNETNSEMIHLFWLLTMLGQGQI